MSDIASAFNKQAIQRARDSYVDVVTVRAIHWLSQQGIVLTSRGETQLSDIIRFETTP